MPLHDELITFGKGQPELLMDSLATFHLLGWRDEHPINGWAQLGS